ncbi:BspA family leucine-rich repeat surface protein [Enterococcus sp. AZ126]|uniref:BspA family leucine-rich repeat surface protein n=1 Tax=Enterococcus sp. AZ126 TaxID=2774635 RepID=UPI003F212549
MKNRGKLLGVFGVIALISIFVAGYVNSQQHTIKAEKSSAAIERTEESKDVLELAPIITTPEETVVQEKATEPIEIKSNESDKEEIEKASPRAIYTGRWGTVPWSFDTTTGTLTFTGGGTLASNNGMDTRPWGSSGIKSFTGDAVKKIIFTAKTYVPENPGRLFGQGTTYQDLPNLSAIEGWQYLDTSRTTDGQFMFYRLGSSSSTRVTGVDLATLDTSRMTDMSGMLGLTNFTEDAYNVEDWDVSKVTSMISLFNAVNLPTRTLNLSKWDTSKVTNMNSTFTSTSINSLNLSNWNTSNVTAMNNMFSYSRIDYLNLQSFNTSKVTTMENMFRSSKTTILDLSSFTISSSTTVNNMFATTAFNVLSLGKGFQIGTGLNTMALPGISSNTTYSGNWVDVGQGTVTNPLGNNAFNSNDLIGKYTSSMNGVYVRQRLNGNAIQFQLERTNDTAKIVDLSIDKSLTSNIKTVEISMPTSVTLTNRTALTMPSGWSLAGPTIDSNGKRVYTLNMRVNGSIDLPTLITLLQSMEFNVGTVKTANVIGLKIGNGSYIKGSTSAGFTNYYKFVPSAGISFVNASTTAASEVYKNTMGGLPDIQSAVETTTLASVARQYTNGTNQVGWTAGTRLYNQNSKTRQISTLGGVPTRILTDTSFYSLSSTQANNWYWGNTGRIFYTSASAQVGAGTGLYNGFSNSQPYYFLNGLTGSPGYLALNGTIWEARTVTGSNLLDGSEMDGYFVKFAVSTSNDTAVDLKEISSNAFIPQPLTIHYQDSQGKTLADDVTTGTTPYRIGNVLDQSGKMIPGYVNPVATVTGTSTKVAFPLQVKNVPQDITVTYTIDPATFTYQVTRNQNTAKLSTMNFLSGVASFATTIEVRTPKNVTIQNFASLAVPSGWGASKTGAETDTYRSYIFASNNEKSISTIQTFLQGLNFIITDPVDQSGQITILLHSSTRDSVTTQDIPQPIQVAYIDQDGAQIQAPTTFGTTNYTIGTQLLASLPSITGYKNPKAVLTGTNETATFPLIASKTAVSVTITYERSFVKATIQYLDKEDGKAIFSQATTDGTLKAADVIEMTVGSNIQSNIQKAIDNQTITLVYPGYDEIGLGEYSRSDGSTDTTVPANDFTLIYKYTPQTSLVDVPAYVPFGSINVANLLFSQNTFWPNATVVPVEILNTNRTKEWQLQAKMEKNMQRQSDGLNMYGKLLFTQENGTPVILGDTVSTLLTETQMSEKTPVKKVSVSDKNTSSLSVKIFDLDAQAKEIGTYEGTIGWYLVDAP